MIFAFGQIYPNVKKEMEDAGLPTDSVYVLSAWTLQRLVACLALENAPPLYVMDEVRFLGRLPKDLTRGVSDSQIAKV